MGIFDQRNDQKKYIYGTRGEVKRREQRNGRR